MRLVSWTRLASSRTARFGFQTSLNQNKWTPGILQQFGSETNWRQLAQGRTSVVLLKNDGTLWRWGASPTNCINGRGCALSHRIKSARIPTGRSFSLCAVFLPGETDGDVWDLDVDWKTGKDELGRATNYDEIVLQTASSAGEQQPPLCARTEPCGCSTGIGTRKAADGGNRHFAGRQRKRLAGGRGQRLHDGGAQIRRLVVAMALLKTWNLSRNN